MEIQYRIPIWASMIVLEFGNPPKNEILQINGKETIIDFCLNEIPKNEIVELSDEIAKNKNMWLDEIKTRYNKK